MARHSSWKPYQARPGKARGAQRGAEPRSAAQCPARAGVNQARLRPQRVALAAASLPLTGHSTMGCHCARARHRFDPHRDKLVAAVIFFHVRVVRGLRFPFGCAALMMMDARAAGPTAIQPHSTRRHAGSGPFALLSPRKGDARRRRATTHAAHAAQRGTCHPATECSTRSERRAPRAPYSHHLTTFLGKED